MVEQTEQVEEAQLPEFTLKNVLGDIKYGVVSLFNNPFFALIVTGVLMTFESLALKAIIYKIPYTEIDYSTYMQQIEQIERGQLDYAQIKGDTGPIVYPGGYVYIYSWMKWFTEGMEDINTGQQIFRYLYLATLLLTFVAYFSAQPKLKPADLFSSAVSVKMNALLYLPGYLVVAYFLCGENLLITFAVVVFGLFVQVGINWDFLTASDTIRSHFLQNAFDFKRSFLYEWTVNWKFVPESIFNSREFHTLLLAGHVGALVLFGLKKWTPKSITGKSSAKLIKDSLLFYKSTIRPENVILSPEGPRYVFYVMATSNLIGIIFARSLHYQFLSWYFWTLPMLLQLAEIPWYIQPAMMAAHEWCWNVYPTTATSSGVLVAILGSDNTPQGSGGNIPMSDQPNNPSSASASNPNPPLSSASSVPTVSDSTAVNSRELLNAYVYDFILKSGFTATAGAFFREPIFR
ncbi:hypothetical protein OGAPHI_000073 [Ogataea philodendri]|uniref:Dol-P-Man:Man(5)GlcNAc(2)-PP-Dol alpha-1,3-mannosyltransferase n=1 Tax=Ogataea philodendri TaxID=1378263 RepID=A0A9P8PHH3_9ASCO|nr:uncharacterized protein OGAPHI_000073 [Ogataea philodendri]KAH3671887.1 hypothetical protein OGAPHI_000073 [Ogataea philodendri]